jgi:hypothetical protein
MDANLENRWRNKMPPFNDDCLYLDDLVPIANLRQFLISTLNILKLNISEGQLYKFDDWHEHDGIVTSKVLVPIKEIEEAMVSDDTLYASRHGDTFVHWAFYPANLAFLLRYYVLDDNEDHLYPGIWGTCDLTANKQLLETVQATAETEIIKVLKVGNAKTYFDRKYAG